VLVELGRVQQRFKAVSEVLVEGATVTDVARRYGVASRALPSYPSANRDTDVFVDPMEWMEPAGPAQWSNSAFVSGVKHLPVRYRLR
jgi:hypothetical protein